MQQRHSLLYYIWRGICLNRNSKASNCLVEFGEETSSHEFKVDAQEIEGKYNMIIESNIIEEIGINILYSDHCIIRDSVCIPLKLQEELLDGRYCERLFNIHTDSPILK